MSVSDQKNHSVEPIKARLLVVDDSRSVRFRLRQILEQDQEYLFDVQEAHDGGQAIRFLSANEPDHWPKVILLDRNMPEVSGDECIRVLKSDSEWRLIPVLFLTAQSDSQAVVMGLSELRADDYLPKPFDPDEMLARVKVLLRVKQAEDNIRRLNKNLSQALDEQRKAFDELKKTRLKLAETEAMVTMTRVFEKFVPKQFLSRIAKDGITTIQAGRVESETITILFSDIRSFTKISESMTPEKVFAFLNLYLDRMQSPIEKNGGFIDKFIGDAIMALFDGDFHTQAMGSVRAAIRMQEELKQLNDERKEQGLFALNTGIGVHIGHVMLGTLGNEKRMDSTVIGDAVNLASRLEGLTKYYGCSIIISEYVVKFLEKECFCMRELDLVAVKGREEPVTVYEVFDHLPKEKRHIRQQLAPFFKKGIQLFRSRHWEESLNCFQLCLDKDPGDDVSRIYLDRCIRFRVAPPPDSWDGSIEMRQK